MREMEALGYARSLFRQRRTRDEIFPAELFGEPAWDLILALYIARCEGSYPSMRALSLKLKLPLANISEWIGILDASLLIQKESLTAVNEGTEICISDAGFDTITTMLLERPVGMLN